MRAATRPSTPHLAAPTFQLRGRRGGPTFSSQFAFGELIIAAAPQEGVNLGRDAVAGGMDADAIKGDTATAAICDLPSRSRRLRERGSL